MAARVVSAVLGIWLMLAPSLLGYGGAASTNARILGPIVIALSVTACSEVARGLRFVVLPLAVWCASAPFFLGYRSLRPTVNDIAVGVALSALVFLGGKIHESFGGGWRALVRAPSPPVTARSAAHRS